MLSTALVFLAFLVAGGASSQGPVITSVTKLSDGNLQFSITNQSKQAITAFVVTKQYIPVNSSGPHVTVTDRVDGVANSPFQKPLLPGQTQTINFGRGSDPSKARVEIHFQAALFADGSTYGNPAATGQIIRWRSHLYQEIEDGLRSLQAERLTKITGQEMAAAWRNIEGTRLRSAESYEEKAAIREIYETMAVNMIQSPGSPTSAESAAERTRRLEAVISLLRQREQRLLQARPPVNPN